MTAILDLMPLIQPFVRDCSTPAAYAAARFACIEFYAKTLWQQEMLEPVDLIEAQATYEIEVMPNTVVAEVMRIEIEGLGQPLIPMTKDRLDQLYGQQWTTLVGGTRYYTQIEPDEIILVPAPDVTIAKPNAMRILCAVQPTPDASEIDDTVFNYYSETLAYGARARLMETAGQPYFDPTNAPFCWNKFYWGVSAAKARRMQENTRAVQRVYQRQWV